MDKPPLLFYSQAAFYPLFGPVEWAARLPAFIASLLLIPLTGHLARRLTGDRTAAVLAAAVVAVAPLAIQFSATAFSDPLLTFWLVVALIGVAGPLGRARPGWAGVAFGLALATKYQAALFLPLVLGIGWLSGWRGREWRRWLAGVGVAGAALLLWAVARAGAAETVLRQWANIGGLRPARSWELGPRLAEIGRVWRLALGWPLALAGLGLGAAALSRRVRARLRTADGLLAVFILAYALLHWLWAVPAWDRYWLPVLPLVAVLVGRVGSALARAIQRRGGRWRLAPVGLLVALAALHLPVAAAARAGRYPIGGQPTADGGAAAVAALLADALYGTVLYDHDFSWHWRYQLFDRRVYVSWFPHADALLDDLAAFGGSGPGRYVALPAGDAARPILRRLAEAGHKTEKLPGPTDAAVELWRIFE